MPPAALLALATLASAPAFEEMARTSALDELSGVAASRKYDGVLWAHNDSGNDAELFALTREGKLRVTFPVASRNVDWEDIAATPGGDLWICDCGNNKNRRKDLRLLRVKEPDPSKPPATLTPDVVVRFSYAEQKAFPPPPERKNFDAEALFFTGGKLHLLTKHRGDNRVVLYRFDDASGAKPVTPTKIAERDLGEPLIRRLHMVTAADISGNGRVLALLTYGAVYLFSRRGGEPWLHGTPARIPLDPNVTGQAEALTFLGDEVWFGNEDGVLFRLAGVRLAPDKKSGGAARPR
jgi:hypothetical protein